MNIIKLLGLTVCCGAIAAPAHAVTMGVQNFDDNTPFSQELDDNTQLNIGDGRTYDGTGLGWSINFNDTRGNGGPLDSDTDTDAIGVTDDIGDVGSFTTPSQGFVFNDTDGQVELVFEPIDVSGFSNVQLSFDYFVNDTGYENNDSFIARLGGAEILNLSGSQLNNVPGEDFQNLTVDVDSLPLTDNQPVLEILAANGAAAETFYVDSIAVTGDAIPVPFELNPTFGLLFIGGIFGFKYYKRSRN